MELITSGGFNSGRPVVGGCWGCPFPPTPFCSSPPVLLFSPGVADPSVGGGPPALSAAFAAIRAPLDI
eukprot:10292183-Karenia_brevis.AAC.1